MIQRSQRHHEIPKWLLKQFCWDCGETLWMGFKGSRLVKPVKIYHAFVRKNANTRTDYQSRGDGTFYQMKSDPDEQILEKFDGQASIAARALIDFSRWWRASGPVAPRLSSDTVKFCQRIIVAQARRTWESQDRVGLGEDQSELYLDLYIQRAEQLGLGQFSREDLIEGSRATGVFDVLSQNLRANMASGNDPILAGKEEEFLSPLGLHVAVIDPMTAEFVIGSHGVTIVETTQGLAAWLPLAPDVAISLSDRPGEMGIGISSDEFVEQHNFAALSGSARVAGRSEGTIKALLGILG